MKLLPVHGKITNCNKCFTDANVAWGKAAYQERGWKLRNDPCAWGSCNPLVLILSFSKGDHQEQNIDNMNFNDIPYLIDMSQATTLENPNANEYLERDVKNVCNYFIKIGLKVDKDKVLEKVRKNNK